MSMKSTPKHSAGFSHGTGYFMKQGLIAGAQVHVLLQLQVVLSELTTAETGQQKPTDTPAKTGQYVL